MKTNCITKTALEKNYKISLSIAKRMITLILLLFSIISFGQNIGDYQSKATGNWNAAATWDTSKPSQPLVWDNALRFNTQLIEEFFAPLGSFEPSGIINIKPHFTIED